MNKSESIAELATALAAFQGEVKQPLKDKDNPFFKSKYVPLENVVEAITQTASKHGLSFVQYPVNQENKVGIVTLLMHKSGEYMETEPIFAPLSKNDAQGTGSVITYLRRYSLSSVFGITSDEDDDGNSASNPQQQKAPNAPQKATQAQLNAIGAKTNKIAQRDAIGQGAVYENAQNALGIQKNTKQLTKADAAKFIDYLTTLEG